jgi:hypothetical protein
VGRQIWQVRGEEQRAVLVFDLYMQAKRGRSQLPARFCIVALHWWRNPQTNRPSSNILLFVVRYTGSTACLLFRHIPERCLRPEPHVGPPNALASVPDRPLSFLQGPWGAALPK